jgi:putative two-component system response regulator
VNRSVLLVDDDEETLTGLRRILSRRFEISLTTKPEEALYLAHSSGPFGVVVSDHQMPGMLGVELLDRIRSLSPDTTRILLTGHHELDIAIEAINRGGIFRFLTKPCAAEVVADAVEAGLEQYRMVTSERGLRMHLEERVLEQVTEIEQAHLATIFALAKLAESRDSDTGRHLYRIQQYCRLLATDLARRPDKHTGATPELVEQVVAASPLHDIGKVGVPDAVLLKPGRLTRDERAIIETHTLVGASALREVDEQHPGNRLVQLGIELAMSHHERWDGTGYPERRSGEEIPLSARILALADVYDALRSRRCYKQAFAHDPAREIILEGQGTQFDPAVVEAFLATEAGFVEIAKIHRDA